MILLLALTLHEQHVCDAFSNMSVTVSVTIERVLAFIERTKGSTGFQT